MRWRLFAVLPFAVALPQVASAAGDPQVLYESVFDIDGDGVADRAVLVEFPDAEFTSLHIYLGSGAAALDLAAKPSFAKTDVIAGTAIGLELTGKASLAITSCFGCGANKSWEETLTIVHRNRVFVVAGFTRSWDWNSHLADGSVDTQMGGCDINYLTGKGTVSEGLNAAKPVKRRFNPLTLEDWRAQKLPEICEF